MSSLSLAADLTGRSLALLPAVVDDDNRLAIVEHSVIADDNGITGTEGTCTALRSLIRVGQTDVASRLTAAGPFGKPSADSHVPAHTPAIARDDISHLPGRPP